MLKQKNNVWRIGMQNFITALSFSLLMDVLTIIGVVIIASGALFATGRFLLGLLGIMPIISTDQMRLLLGKTIVLAVEFLLAADIIKTIVTPDYYEIGMLGALVVIRTVLTYFLNLELQEIK